MNTYTIRSHTDPTKTYTVTAYDDGSWHCECVGFGYRHSPRNPNYKCSHIKEAILTVQQDLIASLETQLQSSIDTQRRITMTYFCHTCGLELQMPHTFTGKCLDCTKQEVFTSNA